MHILSGRLAGGGVARCLASTAVRARDARTRAWPVSGPVGLPKPGRICGLRLPNGGHSARALGPRASVFAQIHGLVEDTELPLGTAPEPVPLDKFELNSRRQCAVKRLRRWAYLKSHCAAGCLFVVYI